MVPKVAGKGSSFKGAGLYYLHDKKALTSERVALTHTENLPTDDPELALKMMAYTALHQAELKAASGAAKTGRKLRQAVYTYSLAWAPDERPEQHEMIEAARATLKELGVADHEALLVIHTDEPHPHIHVILNRVHPETGLAAKLANDHLKLSRWAEAYEKQQGKIRCEQRVENNALRDQGQFVKDRTSLSPADYHRARKERLNQAFARREAESRNLSAYHRGQREALHDEKEARIAWRRSQIKEAAKPQWAALYRRQKAEERRAREAQRGALSRFTYWLRHRDRGQAEGIVREALRVIAGRTDVGKQLADRHEQERKALAKTVQQQTREAIREENAAHLAELENLKRLQARESFSLRQQHSKESQDLAREIKRQADERGVERTHEPPRETDLSDEFAERVRGRIRKRKKRDEQSKDKDHGRERE